jgi:hypothetical protein
MPQSQGPARMVIDRRVIEKHQGVEKQQYAKTYQQPTYRDKYHECDWAGPRQTDSFDKQPHDDQHPGHLQSTPNFTRHRHCAASFHSFTLSRWPTLCTTSWHPLDTQDSLFAFIAGSVAGSAL